MTTVQDETIDRIAFDIGGTFTDVIVLYADGRVESTKILSLLDTVGEDIRTAFGLDGKAVRSFVHGTTVATNAILEGKLARVSLLTTKGFRDILEMRTQRRPNIYDVNWNRTKSLVPRDRVYEVPERIRADGQVHSEIDMAETEAAIDVLIERRPDAVAVCLINSYANPVHEKAIEAALEARAGGIPTSMSYKDFGEIREYERMSTTVVNAALIPAVDTYLTRLERQLDVSGTNLQVMQSNGGLIASATARRRPVNIIESGPAAGVLAAARIARETGLSHALAFDMGGTTAKATLIEKGQPLEKPGGEVGSDLNMGARFFGGAGHAVQVPTLDIAEVSAGGGSIAWIDPGGALRVGPQGAGAQPGPVCYGRGGTQPTVTDANIVLGYINPAGLAGNTVAIDREAAAVAIDREIARPLGLSLLEAALGIVRVADATTMRALRAVSIERGVDPRSLAMIAFGGSGPIHAAHLAGVLGVGSILVPPFPGIFSAVGLLLAEYRYDAVRSVMLPLDGFDEDTMRGVLAELEGSVREVMAAQKTPGAGIEINDFVDVRYHGQDKSVTLPLPARKAVEALPRHIVAEFTKAHLDAFGYSRKEPAEIVALRVRGTAAAGNVRISDLAAAAATTRQDRPSGTRGVCFDARAGMIEVPIVGRAALGGSARPGPLIIEEWDTTVVVPPEWTVRRDGLDNVVMETARRAPVG